MKKIIALAFAVATMFTTPAQAGIFGSIASSDWPVKTPTAKYTMETYGFDVGVVEWAPKENPNIRCVFVAADMRASGTACYPVEKEQEDK